MMLNLIQKIRQQSDVSPRGSSIVIAAQRGAGLVAKPAFNHCFAGMQNETEAFQQTKLVKSLRANMRIDVEYFLSIRLFQNA